MNRLPLIPLALALFATSLDAQSIIKIAARDGTQGYFPLISAIYAELGLKAEFTVLPSARALVEANSGEYDADIGRGPDILADYPNLVYTKVPALRVDLTGWAKKGSTITIASPADLRQYRIGIVRGTKIIESYLTALGISADMTVDQESLAKMLELDHIDIAISNTGIVNSPVYEVGVLVAPSLASNETFHVLNKKHADLVAKFDRVLKAMKADGRYQRLLSGQ